MKKISLLFAFVALFATASFAGTSDVKTFKSKIPTVTPINDSLFLASEIVPLIVNFSHKLKAPTFDTHY